MLKVNKEIESVAFMCMMVDSNEKGAKTSKSQCERDSGKVKIAKKAREEQLKELKAHVKIIKSVDDVVIGDYNVDAIPKTI